MIPSRKEMMAYWFEHPIAGTFIAFGMVEGIKTVWESFVNPKGRSPFSTYTDVRSGDVLDNLGEAPTVAELQDHHDRFHYENHKNIKDKTEGDFGHLTSTQKDELSEISKELKAASKKHSGQADRIRQLGSTSTTTSTSSAHGGTTRTNAGSTWDKQKMPGERAEMFGGKKKGSVLMGPPSMRRRISLNSITLGGLHNAPQKLGQVEEALPTSEHFGMINMMPEQSDDATDNPWV
jgi:hypothetical protein